MENCEQRLEKLREEIDITDRKIIDCLERRMKLVEEIGRLKLEMSMEVVQEARRSEVMEKWKRQSTLTDEAVEDIYGAIHRAAVEVQKKM